jgi:nucleotide-binding universal stress UspA family protein
MKEAAGTQPATLRERPLSVVLATDGSEHSVKAARVLVDLLGGRSGKVRLVTVLSMDMEPTSYLGELSDADQRRAHIAEETEEAVGDVRRILEEAGLPVSVHHRLGNPPDEVLAEVDEVVPDLVVVGRRGLGRAASLVLGSVSSSLLRHSAVPVLTVP